MTTLAHDGAAALRVEYRKRQKKGDDGGRTVNPGARDGWYVVRVCPCHEGLAITIPFATRERAVEALMALDADARHWAGRV